MNRALFPQQANPTRLRRSLRMGVIALVCGASSLLALSPAAAQVITIDTRKSGSIAVPAGSEASIDRQFVQVVPTKVPLPTNKIDGRTRLDLIRTLQSEQGFAMRPFPRGHKGLRLEANGKLDPAGEQYLDMVVKNGTSAKPGDRLVITDVKVSDGKIVFQFNGGPDAKHRFLRHIQIGNDPYYTAPIVQDPNDPQGARLTLDFGKEVPALTAVQVKALLAPLISFDVKTPIQAFTDTLPAALKQAILDHQVMVGMSTEMVMYAKGAPRAKSREMDGQMPFEEWIYGIPPETVEFVRINGNRVIRVEIAKVGEPPQIFTNDEVSGMLRTNGTPAVAAEEHVKVIREGDVHRDPAREAPAPPPTLRAPGENLPSDESNSKVPPGRRDRDKMRPVQMPREKQPGENPDTVSETHQDSSTQPGTAPAPTAGTSQQK